MNKKPIDKPSENLALNSLPFVLGIISNLAGLTVYSAPVFKRITKTNLEAYLASVAPTLHLSCVLFTDVDHKPIRFEVHLEFKSMADFEVPGLLAQIQSRYEVDIELANDLLRAILHDLDFQQLEARWRNLSRIVDLYSGDQDVEIMVCCCFKDELRRNFGNPFEPLDASSQDNEQWKPLITNTLPPFTSILLDFDLSHNPYDLEILMRLGDFGAKQNTLILCSAAPQLFGIDEWTELAFPRDIAGMFSHPQYKGWNEFRQSESAKWIFMTVSSVLARVPSSFEWEIKGNIPFDSVDLCWANSAYCLARVLLEQHRRQSYFETMGGLKNAAVRSLPTFSERMCSGETVQVGPVAVPIDDSRAKQLESLGFNCLVRHSSTEIVFFPHLICLANNRASEGHHGKRCSESQSYGNLISSKFLTSRLMHLLQHLAVQCVQLEWEPSRIESYLNQWIGQHVESPSSSPNSETMYGNERKPLLLANVKWIEDEYDRENVSLSLRFLPSVRSNVFIAYEEFKITIENPSISSRQNKHPDGVEIDQAERPKKTAAWREIQEARDDGYQFQVTDMPLVRNIPFVVGIIADLFSRVSGAPFDSRKFVEVDSKTLDQFISFIEPEVRFFVPNVIANDGTQIEVHLQFRCSKDFDVRQIEERIPFLSQLRNGPKELESDSNEAELIAKQMNEILADPSYRKLASTWNSLKLLVDSASQMDNVKIRVLDCTWHALHKDLRTMVEFDQGHFFKLVCSEPLRSFDGEPFGMFVSDFEFDDSKDSVELLKNIAKACAGARAVFVANAGLEMLSEKSRPVLVGEDFWEDLDDGYFLSSLQSLRNSNDSQFVFLASPKAQVESRFCGTPVTIGAPFVLAEKIQAVLSSFEVKNGIRTTRGGIDYRCDWDADSADEMIWKLLSIHEPNASAKHRPLSIVEMVALNRLSVFIALATKDLWSLGKNVDEIADEIHSIIPARPLRVCFGQIENGESAKFQSRISLTDNRESRFEIELKCDSSDEIRTIL